MMFPAPLAKSLLMAASIGMVVPMLAQTPRLTRAAPVGRSAEDEQTLPGVAREWEGGWVALMPEGNSLVLRFYDAKRQPVPVPVARAAARWNPVNKPGQQRAVLNPAGDLLRSPPLARPPYVYTVYVTLLSELGEGVGAMNFDLRELMEEPTLEVAPE